MKIIFVTREGYNLSGARVRCYNFARELKTLGLETEVFSFADTLGAPYGEREFSMGFTRKIGYNFRALKQLWNTGRDTIFYIQRLNYHSLAPLWTSLCRKNKVIFDCDDWNIREDPVYYLGFYPSSKMEYCTRRIARSSFACIAASKYLNGYLGQFNKRTYYIPTGVDTDIFKPSGKQADNSSSVRFSWIGTVYHKEMKANIIFILECFSRLASHYPHISLSLAGEGGYFEDIKAAVAQSQYRDRIEIQGWIPPDRIPSYLQGIDVGLLPLIQDTKFNKSKSPTKLFEYMAAAKPSVCSAIGEAKHIIIDGENGMLAGSQEEFTKKMEFLAGNADARGRIGQKARETVERDYSLKILGQRLFDIVREQPYA